uniref:Uncharacterized protein n=1 Tax=Anguilla anguilla TaxID=7936 RepID=A0A0E9TVF1_ANGAN
MILISAALWRRGVGGRGFDSVILEGELFSNSQS